MRDYSEARWKMDKFMSDDANVMEEYHEIIGSKDVNAMEEFLDANCVDEERMHSYFPSDGTINEFAKYLVDNG
jgi:hypothetical protein